MYWCQSLEGASIRQTLGVVDARGNVPKLDVVQRMGRSAQTPGLRWQSLFADDGGGERQIGRYSASPTLAIASTGPTTPGTPIHQSPPSPSITSATKNSHRQQHLLPNLLLRPPGYRLSHLLRLRAHRRLRQPRTPTKTISHHSGTRGNRRARQLKPCSNRHSPPNA